MAIKKANRTAAIVLLPKRRQGSCRETEARGRQRLQADRRCRQTEAAGRQTLQADRGCRQTEARGRQRLQADRG
jgi:hypothetical protein